jgi:hypothetical protein
MAVLTCAHGVRETEQCPECGYGWQSDKYTPEERASAARIGTTPEDLDLAFAAAQAATKPRQIVERPDLSQRTVTVERPDLSRRTTLNKSALSVFDLCQTKSWYSLHDPRPFVPKEQVTFGSAIDAAVEVVIKYAGSGQEPDLDRATDAAVFIVDRDDRVLAEMGLPPTGVDLLEIQSALVSFVASVLPTRDWSGAITQYRIATVIDGLGESDGHPDIIVGDRIDDVKATTSKSPKDPKSLELGFYAILREAEGFPVSRVGYIELRRGRPNGALVKPQWLTPSIEVTPEFRRWAYEKAASYVRAKKADAALNAKAETPNNYSFPGGPRFTGLCSDCEYRPSIGGPCLISLNEPEILDVA